MAIGAPASPAGYGRPKSSVNQFLFLQHATETTDGMAVLEVIVSIAVITNDALIYRTINAFTCLDRIGGSNLYDRPKVDRMAATRVWPQVAP